MLPTNRKGCWIVVLGLTFAGASLCQAQTRSRVVPNDTYLMGFPGVYNGDYVDAARAFNNAASGGVVSAEGRWIDSICYATMLGECQFHAGNNNEALEQFNTALRLYVQHNTWMLRFQTDTLQPLRPVSNDPRTRLPWGRPTRNTLIARVPETMPIFRGNTEAQNEQIFNRGGTIEAKSLFPIRAAEIARCIALAIYRKQEILGPLGKYDNLNNQVVTLLQRRQSPPNHWLGTWVDIQHGLALSAIGKKEEAAKTLQRSLTIGGQYDHTLTALALLQLGRIALEQQQFDVAELYFVESTYAAAPYYQYQAIEDAIAGIAQANLANRKTTVPASLAGIARWKDLRDMDAVKARLGIALAECYVYSGDLKNAQSSIETARRTMTRRDMAKGRIGMRYFYVSALINFQIGNSKQGTEQLRNCLAINRNISTRLFQINSINQLYRANVITDHTVQELYGDLLHEPTDADWVHEPLETITQLLSPNPKALANWLEVALVRDQTAQAIEIADRIRRLRFFSTLPMGGRLMALRWILDAPKEALDTKTILQRQDLFQQYPKLEQLSEEAYRLRTELTKFKLQPADSRDFAQQGKVAEQLQEVMQTWQQSLEMIALRRIPSQFLFPPLRSADEIQKGMGEKQLVLDFHVSDSGVLVFLFSKTNIRHFVVEKPKDTQRAVQDLMRQLGLVKRDSPIQLATIQNSEWKETSSKLLKQLIPTLQSGFFDDFDELIIVPDGAFWNVPFEALHVDDGLNAGNTVPLIEKIAVRYTPTAGLILPQRTARRRPENTAIVTGRLFNSDKSDVTQRHFDALRTVFENPARIDRIPSAPTSVLAKTWDQMVVLDDNEGANRGDPWAWSPAQADRSKLGSDLASWTLAPLSGPQVVYLPGFHSSAEDGASRLDTQDSLFFTSLGLMASGADTIFISRWHSGGGASVASVEATAKYLVDQSAAKAWQAAIADVRAMPLDILVEPRLRGAGQGTMINADHPFFWADMMMIDSGIQPATAP